MKGARPLQWIWDWLGQGSMGEPYEVLPIVQPSIDVTGLEMPVNFQYLEVQTAALAGAATVSLKPSRQAVAHLYFQIWTARDTPVATDNVQLIRTINNKLTPIVRHEMNMLAIPNVNMPLVGGPIVFGGFGAAPLEVRGRGPIVSTFDAPLSVQYATVAAVGICFTNLVWAEVPSRAVLPAEFLL